MRPKNALWPRRLLHLPSMTSLERIDEHTYGDFKEPLYGALSYTWGRYEITDGERLDVKNLSWKIPSIDPNHFTAAQFRCALERASSELGLVWVDIACIDQENLLIKMDEIGRQAGIFKGADSVCCWLTSLSTDVLCSALRCVNLFSLEVQKLDYQAATFALDNFETLLNDETLLVSVEQAFSTIFHDPWFSSLWTLQEAYLCQTATILSKDADVAPPLYRTAETANLSMLGGDCEEIKLSLATINRTNPSLRNILDLIERSGLSTLEPYAFDSDDVPPMVLYTAAAFRTTREPLDRIYAIMQVYNLRLGASAEANCTFTLTDLEDQLGMALNRLSPIAAQLHVHTQPQQLDKTWRVGQHCFLPVEFYQTSSHHPQCTIKMDDRTRRPYYTGYSCTVEQLIRSWAHASANRDEVWYRFKPAQRKKTFSHYQANIHLDANHERGPADFQLSQQRRPTCPCNFCHSTATTMAIPQSPTSPSRNVPLQTFLRNLPSPSRVLLLGNTTLFRFVGPNYTLRVASKIGLLASEEVLDGGKRFWKRIGICSWEKTDPSSTVASDDIGDDWEAIEGFLG